MNVFQLGLSVALVVVGLNSDALGRPRSGQAAEDACLDAYNMCYNNCKGKPDVCYSNCDTVYEHCMHGAGVPGFIKVPSPHPVAAPGTIATGNGSVKGTVKSTGMNGPKKGTTQAVGQAVTANTVSKSAPTVHKSTAGKKPN